MKFIGLLMVNGENDILERTLAHNAEFVDAFYVLDGTRPHGESERICWQHPKCAGYTRDDQLPDSYGSEPRDGWRQHLYEQASADHGPDNWFLLLHGDEVWTADPRDTVTGHNDGFMFLLPFFFPRSGELWDYNVHPLDQLRWHLKPGFPEFRMFRGGRTVNYIPLQHHNTKPAGIHTIGYASAPILHYLYRSPEAQRARAQQHLATGFDIDNYRHVLDRDEVYWTDEMIDSYRSRPQRFFEELACA